MQFGRGAIVLPPIAPLFAGASSTIGDNLATDLLAYESEEQRDRYEADMARYFGLPAPTHHSRQPQQQHELNDMNMRTPTSVQLSFLKASFPPSSSPVKKDSVLLSKNGAKTSLPMLHLDSLTPTNSPSGRGFDATASMNPESPTGGEDEKLRVSRERNRLHAQRTRIRKRELLESLKERIETLQTEHDLLRQAYEFHATAVCLLSLGSSSDHPCIQQLEQMGVSATEDRDENGQLREDSSMLTSVNEEEDFDMDKGEGSVEHEKSCLCYGKGELDEDITSDVCTCLESQLNANGKRPYSSTSSSSNLLVCSKEERERVRRERNRLHARRARLRKKLVLERSQQVWKTHTAQLAEPLLFLYVSIVSLTRAVLFYAVLQAVHDLRSRNDRLRSRLSLLVSSIYGTDADSEDAQCAAA
ncbi:hypothetical protein BBJ28_00009399 [Nothophytophthora sp. Chile5]|nr:hypothetical protein BBJ28_00009399 [Nothophytophthora sp. Chile5]